ncbi:MAG: aminoacetone oxidase family FAD-binding enzyme [Acidobacteria bacterium]|nr:MAG: aminoacetone oxidase family FAD-binding enzyme [Acidobacteriota bacterium]
MTKFDVVVIGAGAAGLFCAIEAGRRGRKVLVVERNSQVGRKIIISGGGRCNFTNVFTSPENFVSNNPHFCKSALARYTPDDFIRLVKKHKIDFYEKKLGQLFCRESSRQIVDLLLAECERSRVEIRTGQSVLKIDKQKYFLVETASGSVECESVVIATGGLSFPKVGATDFGYGVAREFGLKIEPTRPALVPLVFETNGETGKLAGLSIDAAVSTSDLEFRENILFTHRGLSGPAILQISNYWKKGSDVSIDLLPGTNAHELFNTNARSRKSLTNFLSQFMPEKAARLFSPLQIADKPVVQIGKTDLEQVAESLNNWKVRFRDTEGYDKAEVTIGGVSTNELSSQTMEATNVSGLFFIGEVVDVTGWLGGYNFQWAWASGYAAGQAV